MLEVHYFAAARAARGVSQETLDAPDTLGELLDALGAEHTDTTAGGMTLAQIFDRCTFLLDGRNADREALLAGAQRVDIMPPFAGG